MYKWYALIFIIIIFIIGIFSDKKNLKELKLVQFLIEELFYSVIIGFILSAIVFFFVSANVLNKAEKGYEIAWRCSIVSLTDNNQVFVSRYSSTSKIVYNYAVQEQLGKTPYHIESTGGDVSIDDTLNSPIGSEVICYRYEYKDKNLKKKYWDVATDKQIRYVFKVPKGSFTEKFEVDMK